MKNEFVRKAMNGYLLLAIWLVLAVGSVLGMIFVPGFLYVYIPVLTISLFCMVGLAVVNPNESLVLVLFGRYVGTIKENGFYWFNPFISRKKISLRARNFDSQPIKVNDKVGNPIMIGMVLVWRVENTYRAAFEVDEYEHFVTVQSDAALRKLAGMYPYDNFEDATAELTLRSGVEEVNEQLATELIERLEIAGIKVIEARINYIAYASEIAGAMLRRQQAQAVVAARAKIVEGAVGMVDMALEQLSAKKIIDLDEERKAAMVSNLMVVLCSDVSTQPIVNAGTLHN
ncbi:MAG: SPFH domain-containing protein [Bacteroidales bacterium]|jgi:regulator of protease activity HflC (stomatin/prohibitin superfamily)|nr:SPFH domain-containing protein [Bacteroidales bacterium]MDD2571564.1 SPFH domain-containing protein [Bacteroidales bacterium]MDD2812370.1 SPFH domain-containing protein [Bacteroidales bacterium]MDD3384891.1 SPFH domain-containing protein [Bacteroidales bacterium]MDD3872179.1 SPFH domain-containing protein [Bacteroidales bacterium]